MNDNIANRELAKVFENTVQRANRMKLISETKFYSYNRLPFTCVSKKNPECNIVVKPQDTITCAIELDGQGTTAILNMASNRKPGGGVVYGARAQEESLFRCTDLFKTVTEEHYPLEFDQGLYTTSTMILKDKDYKMLSTPIYVDTITVAAINLNKFDLPPKEFLEITEKKIDFILNLAAAHRIDNLVLGAWGCGVYGNDPGFISKMFLDVINTRGYEFKNIVFGVINDKNSVGSNYEIFLNNLT